MAKKNTKISIQKLLRKEVNRYKAANKPITTKNNCCMRRRYFGGSGGGSTPFTPPTNDTDVFLRLSTNVTGTMLEEPYATDIPSTVVTALDDLVGTIYDTGTNAIVLTTNSATGTAPVLKSIGVINSSIYFGGTARPLTFDSLSYFNFFHAVNPIWSLQVKIGLEPGTDDVERPILTTNGIGDENTIGVSLYRTSANKVRVDICDGTGTFIASHTHNTTVNSALGVASIQININDVGTGTGLIRINGVQETFNITSGVDSDSDTNIFIGGSNADTASAIHLADLVIRNRILTSTELSDFEVYFPSLTQAFNPIPQWEIDPNDTSTVWADLSKTTPAVNESFIRLAETKNNLIGSYERVLTSAADSSSALYRVNAQLQNNVFQFLGGDNFDLSEGLMYELGGCYTLFLVCYNQRSATGSHPLSGDEYIVITSKDYAPLPPNPRWVAHGTSIDVGIKAENTGLDRPEVFVLQRNGSEIKGYNSLGESVTITGALSSLNMTDMGFAFPAIGSGWDMLGYICYLSKYAGIMSEQQILARITELRNKYYIVTDDWTPNDYPFDWWFDFSTADNITLSGSDILTATDLTGNSHDASSAIGSRPTWNSSAINGLGAATFNGSQFLSFNSYAAEMSGERPRHTLFVVVKTNVTNAFQNILGFGNSSNAVPTKSIGFSSAGKYYAFYRNDAGSGGAINSTPSHGTNYIIYKFETRSRGSQLISFFNGENPAIGTNAIGTGNSTFNTCALGVWDRASDLNFLNGEIAEIFFCKEELPSDVSLAANTYLSNKYGIAITP